VVLFVIDPSETCGYPIAEQERLLARWRDEFPQLPILAVETKCDLARRPTDRLQVSATTGEGLPELSSRVRDLVRPRGELPPIQEAVTEAPFEEYSGPTGPEETETPSPSRPKRGGGRSRR
jgi:nucleolar GTP-binding protein